MFRWEWRCPGGTRDHEDVQLRADNAADRGVHLPPLLQVLRDSARLAAIVKASVERVREEFALGGDVELECRSAASFDVVFVLCGCV